MKTVTVDDVLTWGPCHSEAKVRELAAQLGERFDALDVLRASHITAEDRLWTVLRPEMIDEPTLHEYACRSAEWALAFVALGGATIDPRSLAAIEVKRRWVRGEATDEDLAAARAAARDAAWDAARAAAWDAARDAARDAAWGAARAAARDAARAAAWDAELRKAITRALEWLGEEAMS
jgi:hypothetical protein